MTEEIITKLRDRLKAYMKLMAEIRMIAAMQPTAFQEILELLEDFECYSREGKRELE